MSRKCRVSGGLWAVLLLALASCQCWRGREAPAQPAREEAALSVLQAFRARVAASRAQMPDIVKAAEVAGERLMARPNALINVPYASQTTFAEDILNRSGGLANALPPLERPQETTPQDVLLMSARSWEKNAAEARKEIAEAHENGWLIVLFASRAGMPQDVRADYLIDNGAATGNDEEGPLNALANCVNGWLWCCEYVGALTRRGQCPGILMSALVEGADQHNQQLQTPKGRHWLGECQIPVEPGYLAGAYLRRVDEMLEALAGKRIQGQIGKAADIIAERIAAGRPVLVSSCTHVLLFEIFLNNRCPWKPFYVVWRAQTAIPQNVKQGDLLVWFGFRGLSTPYEDYGKYIRESGADLITCYMPDSNAASPLVHIDQYRSPWDAEVNVPCPPGQMAPISGINQGLLYRMLDAAVVDKLKARGVTDIKPVEVAPP